MTDKPAPTTDLLKRCTEIHEWRSTGVLSGEALRDYAKRKWPDRHDTLQMAEHETVTEALALLAKWGQPDQAQADSVQEDALSDAVRVPLDSLHADAAYLIGRLRDGSMPYARVIEIIRERIDAAKAAIRASAAYGQAPADAAPSAGAVAGPDDIDAIALTRYKVVHSHDSMFHRFAVVAGDGKQQLYLGRETECQNMTRKFAGAFLDGAFYQSQIAAAPTPAAQAADSVQEDAARYRWLRDETEWEPFDSVWLIKNDIYGCPTLAMDVAIDTARKQGGSHDPR